MPTFELSISSAANREGLTGALDEAWPGAEISETGGAGIKSLGPLPDWVVQAAMLLTITGESVPTVQGLHSLLQVVKSVRHKYPAAPKAVLRVTDGETGDAFELENADDKLLEHSLNRWFDTH